MSLEVILLALVPLLAFVIVDAFLDARKAIYAAMALGLAILAYFYIAYGEFDETMVLEAALILGLGGAALKTNSPVLLKFQPVAVGVIFALFLAWFQFFDVPYLVKILPRMAKIMPEAKAALESPQMLAIFARVSGQLIVLLLLHAAFVAYIAVKRGNVAWILSRLAITPLVMLLFAANAIFSAPL